ncbi:hypothetical protein M378DRAFT_204409 [Amanita muscaria Koide BX008]|uniref:Uncharacterized protein n=1 Tax=Amanita muscaria (strain Koide BX008) TaxID=946122 RepID=A0A0C2TV28_AMAMK|nr:hypothetical protein M378DRAFT_204409 [Amanita muscaria Koide BX008]
MAYMLTSLTSFNVGPAERGSSLCIGALVGVDSGFGPNVFLLGDRLQFFEERLQLFRRWCQCSWIGSASLLVWQKKHEYPIRVLCDTPFI